MKLVIGCDHAGWEYKDEAIRYLKKKGHEVTDFGTFGPDSVDYPDFVHPAAAAIDNGEAELGVLICGSGNGVCMTANKYQKIRAALCWNHELAALARQHNNANMICIPARFVSLTMAKRMIGIFTETNFEGGRHQRRVNKISSC